VAWKINLRRAQHQNKRARVHSLDGELTDVKVAEESWKRLQSSSFVFPYRWASRAWRRIVVPVYRNCCVRRPRTPLRIF